jgi:hypothetical protein
MLSFTSKVVGKAMIEKEVTEKDIETIIVNGFEGGIKYWAGLDVYYSEDVFNCPKDEPWSTWCTKLLIEGKSVKLYDVEGTEDDNNWILTLDKIINGYKLNCIKRPHDSDLENGDATTSDSIIQYALFNEIVFG